MENLKSILSANAPAILGRHPQVLFAYLYGSHVRGEAHLFSDVDVGVFVEKSLSEELLDLELSLSLDFDLILENGRQADVRVLNSLPLAVLGPIVTEGVLIYCSDEAARVNFETRTRMAYFDFRIFLKEYQRQYLETYSPLG